MIAQESHAILAFVCRQLLVSAFSFYERDRLRRFGGADGVNAILVRILRFDCVHCAGSVVLQQVLSHVFELAGGGAFQVANAQLAAYRAVSLSRRLRRTRLGAGFSGTCRKAR